MSRQVEEITKVKEETCSQQQQSLLAITLARELHAKGGDTKPILVGITKLEFGESLGNHTDVICST